MPEQPSPGHPAFSGVWLAGLLWILLTLAVWVSWYAFFGEEAKLTPDGTTVIALILALVVFGGRWCWLRAKRKTPTPDKESSQ